VLCCWPWAAELRHGKYVKRDLQTSKRDLQKRNRATTFVRAVVVLTLGRMMSLHVVCKAPEW